MTGMMITVDGADNTKNPLLMALPAGGDALLYTNLFGDIRGAQGRNMAPGRPGVFVQGGIPPQGSHGIFNATNFVDTGIPDRDAVTLIAVAFQDAQEDGRYAFPVSSYVSAAKAGVGITFSNLAPHGSYALVGRNSGGADGNVTFGAAPTAAPQFLALRVSNAAGGAYDNKTAGLSTGFNSLGGPRVLSGGNYMIGRAPTSGNDQNGTLNIAFAAIFGRVLSDEELDIVYKRVKSILRYTNAGLIV